MKKSLFVGFMVLSLSEVSESAWGMNDSFRPESTSGSSSMAQAEFAERERIMQIHEEDMRRQLDMSNSLLAELRSDNSSMRQTIQSLNDRVLELISRNEVLGAEKDALRQQVTEFTCQNGLLRTEKDSLNRQIVELTSHNESLRSEKDSLNRQLAELTSRNESLRSENDALNRQLAEFRSDSEQKKLEETKRANDLEQQKLEQIRAAEAARLAHNNSIQQQITKLERERNDWAGYIDGRKKVRRDWNQTLGRLMNLEEVKRFEEKQKMAPQKIAAIDQQMANLRAQFQ